MAENTLLDRVESLISSVIDSRYEDTRQEVWVEILSHGPTNEEGILAIAKRVRQKALNKHITEQHKFSSLDEEIGQDPGDSLTLKDFIGQDDPSIENLINEGGNLKRKHVKKRKYIKMKEAASILGMNYTAVQYRVKRGLLPVRRVSKISHTYSFFLEDVLNLKKRIESTGIKVGNRLGVAKLCMLSQGQLKHSTENG